MFYLYLQSALQKAPILREQAETFFQSAEKNIGVSFIPGTPEEVGKEPVSVIYIATGGTAGLVKSALPSLKNNIVLITSGIHNSLSASMESLTYLTEAGKKVKLLHGNTEDIVNSLSVSIIAAEAVRSFRKMRLGLIGKPSDWLISTSVDYDLLKEKTGITVEDVSMEELLSEIDENTWEENEWSLSLLEKPFQKDHVRQALAIYGAFQRIVGRHHFDGISVRCFDLLTSVNNTGCLGLAILNACGIYGGCESDLPSLISMAILGTVSHKPVFMCNPSRVNDEKNEIIFAHCTLPLNMSSSYDLDTHFESDIGVAVAGNIPCGPVTVFKASADLSHYFVSSGEILEDLHDPNLCRTQIRLHIQDDVNNFLSSRVGNHYLVCPGDFTEAIREVMNQLMGV